MSKSSSTSTAGSVILVIFGLPFLAAGLFMTWLYLSPIVDWWGIRSWEETPCQVIDLNLSETRGKNTIYKVEATYQYTFRGVEHTSEQVNASFGADNLTTYHQDKFNELSPFARKVEARGRVTQFHEDAPPYRCFVNPKNPSEAVLDTYLRWQALGFLPIFALTFPAVGFFLVFSPLLFGKPKTGNNPRSIPDGDGSSILAIGIYTAWTAFLILPMLFTVQVAGIFREEKASLILLIYAGLLLLLGYILSRRIRRRKLTGKTSLELDSTPVRIGSTLTGHIASQALPKLMQEAELTLLCKRTVSTGVGKHKRRVTDTLWEQSTRVPASGMRRDVGHCKIPFQFALPTDAPPTGKEQRTVYSWRLEMTIPGTSVKTFYAIPVEKSRS